MTRPHSCAVGQDCVSGTCGPCPGATPVVCGGACVDTQTDLANCGRCGNDCPTGATCTAGACACPTGEVNCGTACADLSSDLAHCGACDIACPTGGSCVSGHCACPTGLVNCGTACANLSSDLAHCGACGTACDASFGRCVSGACACTDGLDMCGGNNCFDTQNDPSHCGSCGGGCGDAEYCVDGACICRPGLTDCGGQCVDLQTNDNSCGTCGYACNGAGGRGDVCSAGTCVGGCPGGTDNCDPNGESCVSFASMATDPLNCDGCNNTCGRDELCADRNCERFTIGRTCTSCPCADCGRGQCCIYPDTTDLVVCLDRGVACP